MTARTNPTLSLEERAARKNEELARINDKLNAGRTRDLFKLLHELTGMKVRQDQMYTPTGKRLLDELAGLAARRVEPVEAEQSAPTVAAFGAEFGAPTM